MEILFILLLAVFLLYFARIHNELLYYRKRYLHSDIYVPSLPELQKQNAWHLQIINAVSNKLSKAAAGRKEQIFVVRGNQYVN